jgi:Uma2 family endonuclease
MSTVLVQSTYHLELIDGREIQKPLPKKYHFLIESYLIRVLANDLPKRYRVGPELNVLCGPDRLVPDVVVVGRDAHYENGDLADPAILCVEIMSPGQTLAELFDKAGRLLKAGTPLCWIIWPERRKVWMYSADDLEEAKTQLRAALPDGSMLVVELAAMWSELD